MGGRGGGVNIGNSDAGRFEGHFGVWGRRPRETEAKQQLLAPEVFTYGHMAGEDRRAPGTSHGHTKFRFGRRNRVQTGKSSGRMRHTRRTFDALPTRVSNAAPKECAGQSSTTMQQSFAEISRSTIPSNRMSPRETPSPLRKHGPRPGNDDNSGSRGARKWT